MQCVLGINTAALDFLSPISELYYKLILLVNLLFFIFIFFYWELAKHCTHDHQYTGAMQDSCRLSV